MGDDRVVLKEDHVMLVANQQGDIPAGNADGHGLYMSDTRFLSAFELRINRLVPVFLSASVDDSYVATIQLVNPALPSDQSTVPRQTISIRRTRFVRGGLHERIGIQNCLPHPVAIELTLDFDADFKDIFDVRELGSFDFLGRRQPMRTTPDGLCFAYLGLDGVRRTTDIQLSPAPDRRRGRSVDYVLELDAHATSVVMIDVVPGLGEASDLTVLHFDDALAQLGRSYDDWTAHCTTFTTDNELLNRLLRRSLRDLRSLVSNYPTGPYPMAGLPWYAVPFGRDGLVVGCQTLALNPDLARGVLRYLAANQGTRADPGREEEPGKILHERREGELANLGQIPHTPYFGSVDSTPLFLVLLVELMAWDFDEALLAEIQPAVTAALGWIDGAGDIDGDGFIEFHGQARHGIRNQGWKDSPDSLCDAQGTPASVPAALIEVQGYVVHAKRGLAGIYRRLGRLALARRLDAEARRLQARLDRAFWASSIGFYAQALDGDKRPVESVASNAGHCLWSGALPRRRAGQVARRLAAPDMFTGWGIRTLSSSATTYNPMSYHNGSVWPHDNSLIADGMRRYGHDSQAAAIIDANLEAGLRMPGQRLPELFCGFNRDRRFDSGPAAYLVSGNPQAWSSAAAFHFLQTALGLRPRLGEKRLSLSPLPSRLFRSIEVRGLRVGQGKVNFRASFDDTGVARVRVLDNREHVDIVVEPVGAGISSRL